MKRPTFKDIEIGILVLEIVNTRDFRALRELKNIIEEERDLYEKEVYSLANEMITMAIISLKLNK